ncbi:HD domain-containing protein [Acidobacteria bacterium AH-259-G07]|nr:HD domain-containing protein [Acidobacteria bacterium AH-259-G07]
MAQIVEGCTDAETIPKPPWRERKEKYIAHLRKAGPSVKLVSAADKLHNARAIVADYRKEGEKLWKRFNASKEDQLWYYRTLVKTFRETDASVLADELGRVVSELQQLVREAEATK